MEFMDLSGKLAVVELTAEERKLLAPKTIVADKDPK